MRRCGRGSLRGWLGGDVGFVFLVGLEQFHCCGFFLSTTSLSHFGCLALGYVSVAGCNVNTDRRQFATSHRIVWKTTIINTSATDFSDTNRSLGPRLHRNAIRPTHSDSPLPATPLRSIFLASPLVHRNFQHYRLLARRRHHHGLRRFVPTPRSFGRVAGASGDDPKPAGSLRGVQGCCEGGEAI